MNVLIALAVGYVVGAKSGSRGSNSLAGRCGRSVRPTSSPTSSSLHGPRSPDSYGRRPECSTAHPPSPSRAGTS